MGGIPKIISGPSIMRRRIGTKSFADGISTRRLAMSIRAFSGSSEATLLRSLLSVELE